MAFLFPYDFLGIIGGYMFFICPYFQATFCQQHTAQNSYLLCIWLAVCQEINIRNHFTEIYRCSEIKGDKVSCPRDRAETGVMTRNCHASHVTAADHIIKQSLLCRHPPSHRPPPPPHPHHALCWSPVRYLTESSKRFNVYLWNIYSGLWASPLPSHWSPWPSQGREGTGTATAATVTRRKFRVKNILVVLWK